MILFLNGTSSSGKTTLAKELQRQLGTYVLNFSIDNILYALPSDAFNRMVTGQPNPGLNYSKLEEGFYRCTRALVDLEHDLILDNAIVSKRSAEMLIEYLGDSKVVMVGLSCSVEGLERRERQRGDRTIGEAKSQADKIHRFCKYDLSLDSTRRSASELANEILEFLRKGAPLSGMERTKQFLRS